MGDGNRKKTGSVGPPPPPDDREVAVAPADPPPAPPAGRSGKRRRQRVPTEELRLEDYPEVLQAASALDLADRHRSGADPPSRATARGALPVAAPTRPLPGAAPSPKERVQDRYAAGDFSGALELAEALLVGSPGDVILARTAQSCRQVLEKMYASRLGSLDSIVRVAVARDDIRWMSLDHRAGFLLSLVDGKLSASDVLDVCGMPRLEAIRILSALYEQGVIALD